jgi:hypothetical protein
MAFPDPVSLFEKLMIELIAPAHDTAVEKIAGGASPTPKKAAPTPPTHMTLLMAREANLRFRTIGSAVPRLRGVAFKFSPVSELAFARLLISSNSPGSPCIETRRDTICPSRLNVTIAVPSFA